MQAETSHIDELLECLVFLTRFYGVPNSQDALTTGLPLVSGRLSTALFSRAAERGGLSAREVIQPLEQISSLLLPCVLQTRNGGACILLEWNEERTQARVIFPQAGDAAQWVSLAQLGDEYNGRLFYVKRQFKFDERSPKVLETRDGHWFWSTLFESRGIYRDVLVASILINLFAIASPLFTMNVYDKIVPNLAFDSLWVLAVGAMVVFTFDFVMRQLRSYFIDIAGKKSDVLLSAKIFAKVMGMKMESRPASTGAFAKHLQEFESVREFHVGHRLHPDRSAVCHLLPLHHLDFRRCDGGGAHHRHPDPGGLQLLHSGTAEAIHRGGLPTRLPEERQSDRKHLGP